MTRQIAIFFGLGLSPKAPGTVGSLAGLLIGALIIAFGNLWVLLLSAIVIYFVGLWAVEAETRDKDDHDPSEIVIDEVAGQLFTLAPLAAGLSPFAGSDLRHSLGALLLAFALFRLFDILKPFPVSWADKQHTPSGVMLDDALAAVMAAGVIVLLYFAQAALS